MDTATAPKRLHYAWVTAVALVLMVGGFACWIMQRTAGPGHETQMFVVFVVIRAFVRAILSGWVLPLWLGMVWGVYGSARPWRGRTWLALAPALIFFGCCVISMTADPPTPQKHFQSRFQAQLPADAREIEFSAPRMADAGHSNYAFRCSKPGTLTLIQDLAVEPATKIEGIEAMFTTVVGGVARDWSVQDWRNALCFVRIDRNGAGSILLTDAAMERVVIGRNPLLGKSEGEHAGK